VPNLNMIALFLTSLGWLKFLTSTTYLYYILLYNTIYLLSHETMMRHLALTAFALAAIKTTICLILFRFVFDKAGFYSLSRS